MGEPQIGPGPGFRPEIHSFDFAGATVSLVDAAQLLASVGEAATPVLHPPELPSPLGRLSISVLRRRDPEADSVVLRARVGLPKEAGLRAGQPAITDTVTLLNEALVVGVSRLRTRLGIPDGGVPPAQVDPYPEVPSQPGVTVRDEETGISAAVLKAGPSMLLEAAVPAAEAGEQALRGFVRIVLDVARGLADAGADDAFFAGHEYRISGFAADAPEGPGPERVRLDQLAGLDDVVAELREVVDSFNHPEVMAKWGARRPQGILMWGPPGTGKTTLARALATEINGTLREIRTPEILSKWVGDSEKKVKRIFAEARAYREPTVLLFDEFDAVISYLGRPDNSADQMHNSIAGIFKQEMNTLVRDNPRVIVVATTNFPERVDESLIRSGRFDVKLGVPLPDLLGRTQILNLLFRRLVSLHERHDFRLLADDVDVADLAGLTGGMSGADLREMLRRVQLNKAMQEVRAGVGSGAITQEDLRRALTGMRRRP